MSRRPDGPRAAALLLACAYGATITVAGHPRPTLVTLTALGLAPLAAGVWHRRAGPVVAGVVLLGTAEVLAVLLDHWPTWTGLPAGLALLAICETALWRDGIVDEQLPRRLPLDRRRLATLGLVVAVDAAVALLGLALAPTARAGTGLELAGIALAGGLLVGVARLGGGRARVPG